MSVTVIITRAVRDRNTADRLASLMIRMRSMATVQPGFISSQTFSCLDCEGEYLVLSNWNSMEDWLAWRDSDERREIQRRIDELVGEETFYRYYEPLVGGIPPRFNTPAGS